MQYIGLQRQIRRNNRNSFFLLITFPLLLLGMLYIFLFFADKQDIESTNQHFLVGTPFVIIGVCIWFLIAWAGHARIIRMATGAKPLQRTENKRVYNLVENLCIQQGMKMPSVYVINDDSLNAFASGLSEKSYAV